MRIQVCAALAAITILLVGCATPPQSPVPLADSVLSSSQGKVGVAMTALPKVDTHLPGAGCLLCLAAASMANQSLTTHSKTLPYEDLPKLKEELAGLLRKKGVDAVVVAEDVNVDALASYAGQGANAAKKDFSPLAKKYNVDTLLVISISTLGFERQYSAYVPTGDPKGVLRGTGYLVNLKDNTYGWYLPVNVIKSADRNWDEAPKFPGLTNAYFQALELGKDEFLKPFAK
jgi:hypothetical protein